VDDEAVVLGYNNLIMYTDNTLTPKEAARLCALGSLATQPMRYGELASSIRHFISHITGPSLDVMGQSIELLRYEGLVETIAEDDDAIEGNAELSITGAGREELESLLTANIRLGATELNKLIIALKFRFLHLLTHDQQAGQIALLTDVADNELARLLELRREHGSDAGFLPAWLNHDIELAESRLNWLKTLAPTF